MGPIGEAYKTKLREIGADLGHDMNDRNHFPQYHIKIDRVELCHSIRQGKDVTLPAPAGQTIIVVRIVWETETKTAVHLITGDGDHNGHPRFLHVRTPDNDLIMIQPLDAYYNIEAIRECNNGRGPQLLAVLAGVPVMGMTTTARAGLEMTPHCLKATVRYAQDIMRAMSGEIAGYVVNVQRDQSWGIRQKDGSYQRGRADMQPETLIALVAVADDADRVEELKAIAHGKYPGQLGVFLIAVPRKGEPTERHTAGTLREPMEPGSLFGLQNSSRRTIIKRYSVDRNR